MNLSVKPEVDVFQDLAHKPEYNTNSWFDRQWQIQTITDPTWGWMDINLDDDSRLSIWFPIKNDIETPWTTYMQADGTQKKVSLEPIVSSVTRFWHNDGTPSPYSYPAEWNVCIPELDMKLEVIPRPVEQELLCEQILPLSHYEAASYIQGEKNGKAVTGYGYIKLTGEWHEDMSKK